MPDEQENYEACDEFGKGWDDEEEECQMCKLVYLKEYTECRGLCSPKPVAILPEADIRDEARKIADEWEEHAARAARRPDPESVMMRRFWRETVDNKISRGRRAKVFTAILMRGKAVSVLEILNEMHRMAPKLVEKQNVAHVREWLMVLRELRVVEQVGDTTYRMR